MPLTRSTHSPRIGIVPSFSRPSSSKNSTLASMSWTTTTTWSIRGPNSVYVFERCRRESLRQLHSRRVIRAVPVRVLVQVLLVVVLGEEECRRGRADDLSRDLTIS